MHNDTEKQREIFYDALKLIAIFFVIYNHIDGFHYYLWSKATGLTQFLYIAVSVFTKIAVPIFFMISGALLLGREEGVGKILSHRVARFTTILVVFSLLTVAVVASKGEQFTLQRILRGLLNNELPITVSYNFLYSYIGLLLLLPFLRKIATALKKQEVILLIALYLLLSSVLPCLRLLYKGLAMEELKLAYPFCATFNSLGHRAVFYPLFGYWLSKNIVVENLTKKQLGYLFLSIATTIVAMSCMTIAQYQVEGKYTQDFLGCFNLFTAAPVFLLVKYAFHKELGLCGSEKFKSFITRLGPLTFFVYLMDELLRYLCFYRYSVLIKQVPVIGGSPFLYSVLWCLISITVLTSVAAVLRKNSLLRKYI